MYYIIAVADHTVNAAPPGSLKQPNVQPDGNAEGSKIIIYIMLLRLFWILANNSSQQTWDNYLWSIGGGSQ